MKKILHYMKGFGKECALGPLFKLLEASFELLVPLVVARIVDIGIGNQDRGYVFKMCLVMILLGIIGLACSLTAQYFAAKAAVGFAARLRHHVFSHILNFSYGQIDTIGNSALLTRMTSDINQIQNGVNLTLRLLLRSPFVVFGAMVMAFTIDFQAASVFAGVIPVLCVIVFGIMLLTMPMYRRVQESLDGVTSATRQNLSGVRVLRAFRMEQQQKAYFKSQTARLTRHQLTAGRVSAMLNPVTFVVVNLAVILLLRVGAVKVQAGTISQGMVIALYNYMSQILVELIKMANLIITMTKAAACADRVSRTLETEPEGVGGSQEVPVSGQVTFDKVTLRYPGAAAPALENISFSVQPGQTVGIIGSTGSGKTSLVNMIPGFYKAEKGKVLLDGVDVAQLQPQKLRSRIGIVPQNPVLFQGSIRENLKWGRENADAASMMEALTIAQAKSVIESRDLGLDAEVSQGGTNFSGGQRQRLTIARALVRKPGILILDDSASALDYATDAGLRKAIRAIPNPPTTFIVSQRAASVREADQILVLDDGTLAGIGTHESLLQNCTVYQEIYYSQFPKEAKNNV